MSLITCHYPPSVCETYLSIHYCRSDHALCSSTIFAGSIWPQPVLTCHFPAIPRQHIVVITPSDGILVFASLGRIGAAALGNDYAGAQYSHAGVSQELYVRQRLWTSDAKPWDEQLPGEKREAPFVCCVFGMAPIVWSELV